MRSQILAILLIAATLMIPSRSLAEPAELVDFAFEDQFRNVHRRADVQGKIVLLIGSDKGGSSFNGSWSQAIRASLKDHPEYDQISELPYSDLRGVPFFMKGFIRSKFPEDPDNWVLMDWKGVIAKAYEFVPKASNTLVFAPDGSLVHHVAGRELEEEKLQQTVDAVRTLLDQLDAGQR
jgi:predicted transcriptional regulator